SDSSAFCTSSTFTSRGTTIRAAIDSSGKFAGIVECPSKCTMGSVEGTSVRSSNVDGRLRVVAVSSLDGSRAPGGTRVLGIIGSCVRELLAGLLVGRALHVPGCFPSLAPPVLVPPSPPLHLSSVPRVSAPPARTPLALPAAVPRPEQAASRNRIPAVVLGASRRFSGHRAAHNRPR